MAHSSARASLEPRGLVREQAAEYCGLTPRGLDSWIKRGVVPGPIAGTHRWDRKALDAALDRLSGLASPLPLTPEDESPEDALAAWKRSRENRHQGHSSS